MARGDGTCPFPDCGRVIDGDEIKSQAQTGRMGEQLFAVVYKTRVATTTKSGKPGRDKWIRGYRAPRPEDDNSADIAAALAEKLPEWEALDIVPSERFPETSNDDRPIQYGMPLWRDFFSPRQLLCHGMSAEVFREMLDADRDAGRLDEIRKAAYGYLALSPDKLRDYNSRMTRWHANREVMVNTFDRHDFAFKWSYAEMAPLITGLGYDWAIGQTAKCIGELVALIRPETEAARANGDLFGGADTGTKTHTPPPITITCKSGDSLDHVADGSIDAVIMDPPYYDNVMYAELSDFFYVWLKRTAGRIFPELFRGQLTDKENEAVANPARFRGEKGARALAGREYQERMASIFAECRRVLKPDGIMTLMFTHKATGAWDALAKGLMEAGFAITASWPINTEASGSLHIKDKAAVNSTVFLACRPRDTALQVRENLYWEEVEPRVAWAVRGRVRSLQEAGIGGVDLYLASFGPALEEFSRYWPLSRGRPRERPEERRRRRQSELFEEEWDPYAVTPEDALDAARREVKRWRLEQLTHLEADADLDPATAFFVLAWDAFRAPVFAYDEALRLARAVGVDLDRDVVGRLAEKKGSDVRLWDSMRRAAKGGLGSPDGSQGMIDPIHHAANLARLRSLRGEGYEQVMVFTQYVDTMDFLRGALRRDAGLRLMCFSGRGGEIPSMDGTWRAIGRDDAKRRFREGEADVLLCTYAAAEGLNFQFCGALINYDMPWNPMRVEQRIGRIDRLGQAHSSIRIVNLHYEGTVETDVYRTLRNRIGLFESVVGRLQPILAQLPRAISDAVLAGGDGAGSVRARVVDTIERRTREAEARGFDLDAGLDEELAMPARAPSPLTMDDLDRVIASPDLMPPGVDVQTMGRREYGLLAPGMTERVRVTSDPAYYEEHAESVELWSPGNPLFNAPELLTPAGEPPPGPTLKDILEQ